MGIVEATRTCLSKYATFSGRARRPEFWWFTLAILIGNVVAQVLDVLIFGSTRTATVSTQGPGGSTLSSAAYAAAPSVLAAIFSLAILLPAIAATARRLHDTDRSGWWMLLPAGVSAIGGILLSLGGALGGLLVGLGSFVAYIVLIVWLASRTQPGPNRFGPEPAAD